MNRADLAEATLRKLKQTDEDNCLTVLAQAWLTVYKCGMPSTIDELISSLNQLCMRHEGYTLKTYSILASALLMKNDVDRALKIFEQGLAEMDLDSEQG